MPKSRTGGSALAAGGIAAILASLCCLGPLVLVSVGLGGAWLSNLQLLEPYRSIFICVALVALFLAYRRVYRPLSACKPGEACAMPRIRRTYQVLFWFVAVLVLIALTYPYVAPLFY